MDDEIPKRYYTIGEAAALLEVNRSVLRFWETEFEGLRPRKGPSGRRLYTPADLALLQRIHTLVRQERLTLEGARQRLAGVAPPAPKAAPAPSVRATLEAAKNILEQLREAL